MEIKNIPYEYILNIYKKLINDKKFLNKSAINQPKVIKVKIY